jgi:hypothetical protein
MLISFCKQDADAEETAKTDANALRLNKIVVSLDENFGQGFRSSD